MTATTSRSNRMFTIVGAGTGLVVFLAVALLPSIVYGGYAGVLLAGALFGTPVGGTVVVHAIIGLGMVVGAVAVASLFAAAGAVAGAAVSALTHGAQRESTEPKSKTV
jgi:hypothetical protein